MTCFADEAGTLSPPLWTPRGRQGYVTLLFFAALLAVCAAVLFIGVPRSRAYGHDVLMPLDGAWRLLNGQRPGADFYAILGPAWYMVNAFGLTLAKGKATGLAYATAITTLVVGLWAWALLHRRMTPFAWLLAALFLVLIAAAPFVLGEGFGRTTFCSKYNRFGYAFLGLVLLECVLREEGMTWRSRFASGFSSGAACAVCLFLKVSFGAVGLGLIACLFPFRRLDSVRLGGIVAGLALMSLPFLAFVRFDVAALVREYRMLAGIRGSFISYTDIMRTMFADRWELTIGTVLAFFVILLPSVEPRRKVILTIAWCICLGVGQLLMQTNFQPSGLPLSAMLTILMLDEVTRAVRAGFTSAPHGHLLLTLSAAGALLPMAPEGLGLAYASVDKTLHPRLGYHFEEPQLAGLDFLDGRFFDPFDNGQYLVGFMSEGFALLREHSRPHESIASLSQANIFPYALGRRPANNGAVFLAMTSVGENDRIPPLTTLIGDADILMVPKYETPDRIVMRHILARYPELLGAQYQFVAESAHWKLYRRVGTAG